MARSGFSGTRGWDVNSSYKFNGARGGNGNNAFMINGALISDNGSQWDMAPNAEAVQEFKAVTTAYDASYGHEAGGVVNQTIKSGSNRWNGDLFEYLRNGVLDANYFQSNLAGQARGRHEVSQFGGVFGGPIRKDKDFLFVSFEGWQEAIPFPGCHGTARRFRTTCATERTSPSTASLSTIPSPRIRAAPSRANPAAARTAPLTGAIRSQAM